MTTIGNDSDYSGYFYLPLVAVTGTPVLELTSNGND